MLLDELKLATRFSYKASTVNAGISGITNPIKKDGNRVLIRFTLDIGVPVAPANAEVVLFAGEGDLTTRVGVFSPYSSSLEFDYPTYGNLVCGSFYFSDPSGLGTLVGVLEILDTREGWRE
jgi:hypothetical protein